MMLMEKVEYVSGGPTSPLSITNIVHSGVFFFFLVCRWKTLPNAGQVSPSTTERNYLRKQHKKKCRDQNVPPWTMSRFDKLSFKALRAARACWGVSCCLQRFSWEQSVLVWPGRVWSVSIIGRNIIRHVEGPYWSVSANDMTSTRNVWFFVPNPWEWEGPKIDLDATSGAFSAMTEMSAQAGHKSA